MEHEIHYNLLKILEESPRISQRQLAARLGVSLGKANYCLRAVVERGWVKMGNFRRNPKKLAYAYLLTPSGIEQKARFAVRFLKHKMEEFDLLRVEIERLRIEVDTRDADDQLAGLAAGAKKDRH